MANPLAGRLQLYVAAPWNGTDTPEATLEQAVDITDNEGELLKITDRWMECIGEDEELIYGTITMHVQAQIAGGVQMDEANQIIRDTVNITVEDGNLIEIMENSVLGAKTLGAERATGVPAEESESKYRVRDA